MRVGRSISAPSTYAEDDRGATGRPVGAGHVIFADAAEQLLAQGFEPLPIKIGTKAPAVSRWTKVALDAATIEAWKADFSTCGIGLRTGRLVGLDIDCPDADEAHRIQSLAQDRFGETLMRVGQWPKRLLLYRTETPFAKMRSGSVEILGAGQQFVAFGRHAATGKPYYWPFGETVLDCRLGDLPVINEEDARGFLAEAAPVPQLRAHRNRRVAPRSGSGSSSVIRRNGLVVDGRDAWLSQIAFHCVHDALELGGELSEDDLAHLVWSRFSDTTSLDRPRGTGHRTFQPADALRKVEDKLRLAREGRLPGRDAAPPTPVYTPPTLTLEEGRERLQAALETFCEEVVAWQRGKVGDAPTLGVRATVGIGKSHAARSAIRFLMKTLRAEGLPHRVLVFTPSHALAEETAAAWNEGGVPSAVLRGYERKDPASGEPMCRDIEMVRAVLAAGLSIHDHACHSRDGATCRFLETCLKQHNRRDVAAADVVVAPYDALFSGLAFEEDNVALMLVDEGCWQRAVETSRELRVEDLFSEPLHGMGGHILGRGPVGAMADLAAWRLAAARGLFEAAKGAPLVRALRAEGLTHDDCQHAAKLEEWRKEAADVQPGLDGNDRQMVLRASAGNQRIGLLARFWRCLADLIRYGEQPGQYLRVHGPGRDRRHVIEMRQTKCLHESLRGKPVLHLDATLRPALAAAVLPRMPIKHIDVATPHMHVRQISGSFGKSMICPAPDLPPEESRRRANRLKECVDYVRWHARRVFPREVLVVTYQAVEKAFSGIPNVVTAHFNAVAGLDIYKDVAMLISIGRPLPPSQEAEALAAVFFGGVAGDGYVNDRVGFKMRSGPPRGLSVVRHADRQAEILRAAICDDELVQVIGRGRGVNRTAEEPLEVHVLADVALPIIHDSLSTWDLEKPDVFQRMLLDGLATDSPADAADLHPDLFDNVEQAKKAFERSVFKGQNPLNTSYREMSLKSAAYRRHGRGRSWQRVYWLSGCYEDPKSSLGRGLQGAVEWVQE